ncbi:MAG: type II toxin-antitoxin system RelE/ParE family toxin [Deferribacterales bacterium]
MYKLTNAAEKDIRNIFSNSLSAFGKKQTDKYFESLKKCLELIGHNPDMGTNIDYIRKGYLKFPHESHVIFYKIESEYVLIIRILHKHMDVEKKIVD